MKPLSSLLLAAALAAASLPALAQDLTIGRGNEPQSIDPQFSRTGPNQMTALHVFDRLLLTDANVRARPGLAVSWEALDDLTWEVKLREGVTFHDGTPFTAADVVYSLERAPNVPSSPASFAQSVADVAAMEIVDDHTIRFTTKAPTPLFMETIGTVYIVSKAATEGRESADFNSGEAAVGTGPYRFVSWTPGDRLELSRNEDYWGEKPHFANVTMRFIDNDAARVAALLSGAVDLIDLVPPADLPALRANESIDVFETPTVRLVYLALNQRDDAPYLTDAAGAPLPENPFQDARVRNAVSLMIDREALIDRVLYGSGGAASQIVPEGVFGYNPDVPVPQPDLEKARALLAEAGYPDGFGITLHGSNDRFSQDGDVAQAVGQLLARGGLTVNGVETLPYSVFAKAAGDNQYGAFLFSYGNSTGEASRGLESVLHSYDKENDRGTLNRFRYSNPDFDAAITAAKQIFDPAEREAALQDAAAIAFGESGLVPLYFQSLAWAARDGIVFEPRRDERTLAMGAREAE
ncbi:ABC transporter substrate-binding protein [Salinarimonas sp.]|uniref:ABC transporter substrate-binding protein n=1 Tax=Salinarimonas sp. TaxID=2766526 RepID=UPI0032D96075